MVLKLTKPGVYYAYGAGSGGCKKEMPRIRGESEPAIQGSEETEREMGVRDSGGADKRESVAGFLRHRKGGCTCF